MSETKAEQQGQEWHPYAVAADRIVYRRRDGTESGDVVWFGGNRIRRDEVLAVLTHHDRLVQALEASRTALVGAESMLSYIRHRGHLAAWQTLSFNLTNEDIEEKLAEIRKAERTLDALKETP